MAPRWDRVRVDGHEMRCYVDTPQQTPAPAVVVIQHAGGVDDFIQTMTRRFASEGFVAIAPDLYHREDPTSGDDAMQRMGRLRDRDIVADVNGAIAHIETLPEVTRGHVGITGFCMGGRVAYLMATQDPELKAAVVFYGGNIMVPWGEGSPPFEQSERINCPILGLFGKDDQNPNPSDVAKLDAELARLGKQHEFHSYGGAGHAFMNEGRPSYRPDAASDAWSRCVDWFRRHLSG